jgi:hypothetical protein
VAAEYRALFALHIEARPAVAVEAKRGHARTFSS